MRPPRAGGARPAAPLGKAAPPNCGHARATHLRPTNAGPAATRRPDRAGRPSHGAAGRAGGVVAVAVRLGAHGLRAHLPGLRPGPAARALGQQHGLCLPARQRRPQCAPRPCLASRAWRPGAHAERCRHGGLGGRGTPADAHACAPALCRVGRSRTGSRVNRAHCSASAGSELHALCPRPRRRGGLWRRGAAGRGGRACGERAGRDRGRRARQLDAPVCRRVHCAGRQHAGAGCGGAPERAAGPLGAGAPVVHHGAALGQGCARGARRGARAPAPASLFACQQRLSRGSCCGRALLVC